MVRYVTKYGPFRQLQLEGAELTLIPSEEAKIVEEVVHYIKNHTRPGEFIFVAPYETVLYFLSQRNNPTRFDRFLPGEVTEADQEEIVRILDERNVRYVIYNEWTARVLFPLNETAPIVYDYIVSEFEVHTRIDDFVIYVRSGLA